jgi:hypothetical protein
LGHWRRKTSRWRVVGHVRETPRPDVASTNDSFVDRGRWRTAKARKKKNKVARLARVAYLAELYRLRAQEYLELSRSHR